MDSSLEFQDWGLIPYDEALTRMLTLVDEVAAGRSGLLIFCSHPPIVTLGRATRPEDVFGWRGPKLEVSRGGRATYHGPSQLVIYPVINLKESRRGRVPQEIAGYLRALEDGLVEALAEHGVQATGKSRHKRRPDEAAADETGVWVGERKIASLGIAVKKWVTFHGAAINLDQDPEAFQGMNPCGFRRDVMVSLEELRREPVDRTGFQGTLKRILLRRL
ncbi:MAG: lipoyl(octanoyl) transferase LipB [Bdellovibrionaceae bacterium]|nr:lipoyl(octanoyl) transferase LipB [Pseudobdellovibrionaceae bacterium]MBX3034831.1 lipoyl(octanoyl) transferase LipB [Pseudobdellovibrionaceae bacterium]